jgi:hypothetical protein
MAILINDNLKVAAPKPIDERFGPFSSLTDVLTSIPSTQRYIGLTCVVRGLTATNEYWFKNSIEDAGLILKLSENTGSGEIIPSGLYFPLSGGTVFGGLTAQSTISDLSGNSDQWNEAYKRVSKLPENGLTAVKSFTDKSNVLHTVTIKNGLILEWTQDVNEEWILKTCSWNDGGVWSDEDTWCDGEVSASWLLKDCKWDDNGIWIDTETWCNVTGCKGTLERELFITPEIVSGTPSASLPGGFTINGFVAGGTLYFDNLNTSTSPAVKSWVLLDHRTNPTWFGLITQSFPNFSSKTKYRFTHPNGTCYEGTIPLDTSSDFRDGLIIMSPITV